MRAPKSRPGLRAYAEETDLTAQGGTGNLYPYLQVCIPRANPIPRRTRKSVRGSNPRGGAVLYLSEAATIIRARIAVPMNSAKKHVMLVK